MVDRSFSQPRGLVAIAVSRLLSRASLLVVLAGLLLALVLASALGLGNALLVFAVMVLVSAMLPAAEIHIESLVPDAV
jgi:hypothetical protein